LALDAKVTAAGALDGLKFHHERMLKTPNTIASHILIRLAYEIGTAALQDQVVELLFAGYFTLGRDIGDVKVLADIGAEAGIERETTLAAIRDPASERAVVEDEGLARRLHLNGVPSLVLNGHYLFSGAQPSSVILQTLRAASVDQWGKTATRSDARERDGSIDPGEYPH
jgi:predicted DsbA family dithiol-disulfide isomerase